MSKRRVAVYGGSFDPPHLGHYFSIIYLLRSGLIDEVWIEPASDKHPFGKKLSPFADRFEMMVDMVDDIMGLDWTADGRPIPAVHVKDHETWPKATGYSLDLIRLLNEVAPGREFRITYGSDLFHARHKFHNWDELCALAKPIFLKRPGFPIEPSEIPAHATVLPMAMAEISSTEIRDRIANGVSLEGLVHPRVIDLIKGNRS